MFHRPAFLIVLALAVGCDDDAAEVDAAVFADGSAVDAALDVGGDPDGGPGDDAAPVDVGGGLDVGDLDRGADAMADAMSDAMADGEVDAMADATPDAMPDLGPPPPACQRIANGYGPAGEVDIDVEVVAQGLDIPWSIGFLPGGDLIVTERTGAILRITPGGETRTLGRAPIIDSGEGGLLGLALHPDYAANRAFYLYYTTRSGGRAVNVVERWVVSEDGERADADGVVVDGIPAVQYHNGGRLRFGPDGMLYVGTGDAGQPNRSQDTDSPAGKILRVTAEGEVPADNPFAGSATWVYGIRNTQGFDWREDGVMVVTDHGPSGIGNEGGRRGHDEISLAAPGDNLGWPDIYACEEEDGMVTPAMTWANSMPPGGAAIYTGDEIAEWRGDTLIGVLGFGDDIGHLHRIRFAANGGVAISETYLLGEYGRLREVVMGPDGGLYVTTSGCDGRGSCGDGDVILRIGRQ